MKRDCTICAAKTKALISCVVTAQLICGFVFAYAKSWFSHDAAKMTSGVRSSVCQLDGHTYCTFCMCDFECMKYYLKNKKRMVLAVLCCRNNKV